MAPILNPNHNVLGFFLLLALFIGQGLQRALRAHLGETSAAADVCKSGALRRKQHYSERWFFPVLNT